MSSRTLSDVTTKEDDAETVKAVDFVQAAEKGFVATDERGQAIVQLDAAEEARLRSKLDWRIVPPITLVYFMCFIDRSNLGNSRIAHIEQSLNLKGYDFNIIATAFYVTYLIFEMPSSLLCKRVGPGRYLPACAFCFGILTIAFAFVKSFAAAIAVRALLGVAEAALLPSITYYLSRFYRRDELLARLSIYVAGAALASALGSLLASAILTFDSIGSVRGWRMIFLVEGLLTVGIAVSAFYFMTDSIQSASWLSDEEKSLAEARIKAENVVSTEVVDSMDSRALRSAIFSIPVLLNGLVLLFTNITVQGLAVFLPTIVRTMFPHHSIVVVQLLSAPPVFLAALSVLVLCFMAWKTSQRGLFIIVAALVSVIGFAIWTATDHTQVRLRYGASFLVGFGSFAIGGLCLGWTTANCPSDTARAGSLSAAGLIGNVGTVISSWTYLPNDAPNYRIGHAINLSTMTGIILATLILLAYLRRENHRKSRGDYDGRIEGLSIGDQQRLGHHHPGFRYSY